MLAFLPYLKVGGIALVLFLCFAGGYHVRDLQAKAQLAHELQLEQAARAKVEEQLNVTSGKYEAERARTAQVQVARVNTIREVYRDTPAAPPSCAVPATAVGVLVGAVQDANAAASGQSGGSVQPASTPTLPQR